MMMVPVRSERRVGVYQRELHASSRRSVAETVTLLPIGDELRILVLRDGDGPASPRAPARVRDLATRPVVFVPYS